MTDNASLAARRDRAVPRGIASSTAIYADRAENAELWDVEGRRYVDFAGGIAVLNTGHRHPKVMAAVEAQLGRFSHTAFQVSPYESYIELAERLNARAPFSGDAKTIFFTTGGEATENAIKVARASTGRSAVIAFTGAFHGRTLLASAMTGKVTPYKRKIGPMPPEVFHAPFPTGIDGNTVERSLTALAYLFAADVDPERVAAVIVEPVQGEGGFHVAPTEFLEALRALADQHGFLLIADEVQAGFGRTGKLFGIEHSGVEPDLVCIAKSLAGGFPLSGLIGRAPLMDALDPGGLGGTYGGSPLGTVAALAVLDVIDEEKLLDRSTAIGERIGARVKAFAAAGLPVANLRGLGAMVGFDVTNAAGETDGAMAKAVTVAALEAGLILLSCGTKGETIRILVPLTASDAIIDEGLDIIEASLAKVAGKVTA
ncbi:4-aminobutyrate--2-oxoglutarate transaminase [Novosphingobium sp. Fuku2-ISO-50]|jgi:4-aminobutyrate aminotransferase / (S)-3-amino-2-methylpropionate transaminase / 5-aminovalerate transaminase|uniref:4-aminobutyrate--2-oxoglutarate transaminase n=1 Tax=Novosphingobium sp. Fuku2-ISO-50 TaxID=1739114 RepID=UPI00076CDCD1|nr:4-aminobutyrate--2-oxoglutarate transaminase [Novosphingobium sp. Fuku2-ISO-50]KUR81303.1 4-aminobutyrate aminotransferase [Novosphingobium sp. Fuku2-ISO-50]